MTKTGPSKKVSAAYASGRLANARAYLHAARKAYEDSEDGFNTNPVMSQIVNAAIAYADALTAKRKSLVNQRDHSGAVKLLREAFGNELPEAQKHQLQKILGEKDEVQYGASFGRYADATQMLAHLEEFARWAERQLSGI